MPVVTYGLILANALVFLWVFTNRFDQRIFQNFGEIPIMVLQGRRLFTIVTSMFLHGDFWHILGNMLYLFVFGNNVEDRFGHAKYFVFYMVSGIVGGLTHSIASVSFGGRDAFIPAIGASGAVAGILGAYLVFFPRAKIVSIVPSFYLAGIARVPAWIFIGFWFILQLLYSGTVTSVAYMAHLGGFITGFIVTLISGRITSPTIQLSSPTYGRENQSFTDCIYCGNPLPDNAIFCPTCGGKRNK